MAEKKLLVVHVAALSAEIAARLGNVAGLGDFAQMQAAFPAVTCTAQASFRTGQPAAQHGMIANGVYTDRLKKIMFWEQAASLVEGPRIWDEFRTNGGRVGLMFWQQSLGERADLIVSPRPIHKHSGGMIQDVYTEPRGLYDTLCEKVGRRFNLMNYWGPLASRKSTDWIVESICAVMEMPEQAPDLLLTYLPHMDYDLQRHGSEHKRVEVAIRQLAGYLGRLAEEATKCDYEILIAGDYAITDVSEGAVFPNGALRTADLFFTQSVKGMAYPDFFASRAFAMVDHEVAHVYTRDEAAREQARAALSELVGIESVLDRDEQRAMQIDHPLSGDLVLVAADGYWFAYPWWTDRAEAPDFASHVDIHNKPGFDPCELFFGWPPGSVSQDTTKVRGSHGRTGDGREIAWVSSVDLGQPSDTAALGRAVQAWLGT